MTDSFLFDAGSLFFVAWIAVLACVSVAAFAATCFPPSRISILRKTPPAAQTLAPDSSPGAPFLAFFARSGDFELSGWGILN